MNISLKFYNGEVNNLNNSNHYNIFPKKLFNEFTINSNTKNFILKRHESNSKKIIRSKKLVIGTGVVPPKMIRKVTIHKNSNYIWDFYSSGGTNNLINKINVI